MPAARVARMQILQGCELSPVPRSRISYVLSWGLMVLGLCGGGWLTSSTEAEESSSPMDFHDPIPRQVEGWTVQVDPRLIDGPHAELGQQALKALANHLQRIAYIVPADRLVQLRKLPIWLEHEHSQLKSMQYHPARGWLLAHGHDPRLVKHVHIPRAQDLLDPQTWAKHPYVVLHELAHAYHDQVLSFDDARVLKAFQEAEASGRYEDVLLFTGKRVRHYGLSNHKEYFAEATEAYFGVNDFYPFVRAELQEHDPQMYALLETIWGKIR